MTEEGRVAIESRLHEIAMARAGLSDFGDDAYLEGLRVIVRALEGDLGLRGQALIDGARPVVKALVGRLYSQKGWIENPEVFAHPIPQPLFITGIPRTGTTALHHLLAGDPRFQGLESWLVATPMVRPPRSVWEGIDLFRDAVAAARTVSEEKRRAHWVDAHEYNECQGLMTQTMVTNSFGSQRSVPSYDAWFRTQDQTAGFLRLGDQLRLIGATSDKRWLLKNPSHLLSLDALVDAFPDACVVVTHRDPVEAIPSLCSLLWTMRQERPIAQDSDPRLIGRRESENWRYALKRYEEVKNEHPARFLDVYQRDLARDPMSVVHLIYERFAIGKGRKTDELVNGLLARTSNGAGVHRYRPEDFGLTEKGIADYFSDYRGRYGFG